MSLIEANQSINSEYYGPYQALPPSYQLPYLPGKETPRNFPTSAEKKKNWIKQTHDQRKTINFESLIE